MLSGFDLYPRWVPLSCFETNIYLGGVLRTHASKPVSDPQTKIICKQTLLICLFALYKLRNTRKVRLTIDQNTVSNEANLLLKMPTKCAL